MSSRLKQLLRPLRAAAGRFVIPAEPPTSSIIFKAGEILSSEQVAGDYLEFGVFRGSTLVHAYQTLERCYLDRAEDRTRIHSEAFRRIVREQWHAMRFFAFDSFQGLPALQGPDTNTRDFMEGKFACSQPEFLARVTANGVSPQKLVTVPGWFSDTCVPATRAKLGMTSAACIHIDCDLYESTRVVLEFIEPLLVDGTVIIFDDWFSFRGNPGLGEQRAFHEWTPRLPHLTFTEFQKEGPWRNSFIVNVRP